jgi:cytochrome c-type biogenesis protein CcmH
LALPIKPSQELNVTLSKANRLLQIILIILVLALAVMPVVAQDDGQNRNVTDDEVNEVARDVYCPVCENTPLDVCQTQACADWRELIRTKLASGESKQDIFDYFARQYGDGVLANPPRRGVSLVMLWVLPVVLILLGFLFFSRYMRGLRTSELEATGTSSTSSPNPVMQSPSKNSEPVADDYLARVEQELNKTDE